MSEPAGQGAPEGEPDRPGDDAVGNAVERRCVVRRESADRQELVRLVAGPDGVVHVDYRARLQGRGAYVTPERAVIEVLEKKPGMLYKALGGAVRTEGLLERVREANRRAALDALSLAARSGSLAGGKAGVRDLLADPRTLGLVVASDASPRLVDDLRGRLRDRPLFTMGMDCDTLGRQIGKGARAALAIRDTSAGRNLVRELRRMDLLR